MKNYIARNKVTGLYFDGRAFNADRLGAQHIEESILPIFKLAWRFYDEGCNGELIELDNNSTVQLATIAVQNLRNISAKLRDLAVINPSLAKQLHEIAGEIYNATN